MGGCICTIQGGCICTIQGGCIYAIQGGGVYFTGREVYILYRGGGELDMIQRGCIYIPYRGWGVYIYYTGGCVCKYTILG